METERFILSESILERLVDEISLFFCSNCDYMALIIVNAVMCVEMLHTHCIIDFSGNLSSMNAQIELNSIAMSKNDPKLTRLDKYDVEANIEEVVNSEEQSVFKYGFTALSNPKNVRLAIEGIATISGDAVERNEILEKDENDIPKILTMIYHELFPTFFLLSKSLNVSSPPHTIGEMGDAPSQISETEGVPEEKEEIADVVSDLNSKADSALETDESPSEEEELETPNAPQQ